MRSESAWTGIFETSWFHGLSGGKTCIASRMRSASGVPNITGAVIFGIGGRTRSAGEGEGRRPRPRGAPSAAARRPGRRLDHVVVLQTF